MDAFEPGNFYHATGQRDNQYFYPDASFKNAAGDFLKNVDKKLVPKYYNQYKAQFRTDGTQASLTNMISRAQRELDTQSKKSCPKQSALLAVISGGLANIKGSSCEHEKGGRLGGLTQLINEYNDQLNTLKQKVIDDAQAAKDAAAQQAADAQVAKDAAAQQAADIAKANSGSSDSNVGYLSTDVSNTPKKNNLLMVGGGAILLIGLIFAAVAMNKHKQSAA